MQIKNDDYTIVANNIPLEVEVEQLFAGCINTKYRCILEVGYIKTRVEWGTSAPPQIWPVGVPYHRLEDWNENKPFIIPIFSSRRVTL